MKLRSAPAFLATLSLACGFAAAAYAAPPKDAHMRSTSAEAIKDNGPPPPECLTSGRNICSPTAVLLQEETPEGKRTWVWYATGWEPAENGCQAGDLERTLPADFAGKSPKVDCKTPGAVALPKPIQMLQPRPPEPFRGPNGMPLERTPAEALRDAPPPPPECMENGRNLCVPTVTDAKVSDGPESPPTWAAWLFWQWDRPEGLKCVRGDQVLRDPNATWSWIDCRSEGAVFEARRKAPASKTTP